MKKVIKEILSTINDTIKNEEYEKIYKSESTDFTRTGKLSFSLIIYFVLGFLILVLILKESNFVKLQI